MAQRAETLGGEIKRLRIEADIPLRRFAERIGISAAHQSDIEHDRRRPSPDLLRRIVAALAHVGATYENLDRLDTRLDPDIQEWASDTPGVRQILRVVRDSGQDPRDILRDIEQLVKGDKPKERP